MNNKFGYTLLVPFALTALATGCSDDSAPGAAVGTPVAITADNMVTVAEDALAAMSGLGGATSAVPLAKAGTVAPQPEIARLAVQIKDLVAGHEPAGDLPVGVVETENCTGGGTISYSYTPGAMTATATLANCVEDGVTLHGSIVVRMYDTGSDYTEKYQETFNNLVVTHGADSLTLSGTLVVVESESQTGASWSTHTTSSNLRISGQAGGEELSYTYSKYDVLDESSYSDPSVVTGAVHVTDVENVLYKLKTDATWSEDATCSTLAGKIVIEGASGTRLEIVPATTVGWVDINFFDGTTLEKTEPYNWQLESC